MHVVKVIVLETERVEGALNIGVKDLITIIGVAVSTAGARRLADYRGQTREKVRV